MMSYNPNEELNRQENTENIENTEDTENREKTENTGNIGNTENAEAAGNRGESIGGSAWEEAAGAAEPVQASGKKKEKPASGKREKRGFWKALGILVLAAAVGFAGGYAGATIANENIEKVVIQQVTSGNSGSGSSDSGESGGEMSGTEVAAAISPSVVSITTEQMVLNQYWFGAQVSSGAGSGIIISSDGYILTCAHVITGADTIVVTTSDGTEYDATVVGSYENGDIAVLKIEAEGLQAAVLGDSDQVQLGETVYAVGNPGGTLGGTMTDGIISATQRTITVALEDANGNQTGTITLDVMQTSAAVSPGNSGGGLFNSRGELIGVVNAKSSGENQEGLGFAIPINKAQEIAQALITDGSYTDPNGDSSVTQSSNRAVLNIVVTEIDNMTAQMTGYQPGVYVRSVVEGGASDGLLEAGDRIISAGDQVITTTDELSTALSEYEPGDVITILVEREGQLVTVDVTLAENTAQTD